MVDTKSRGYSNSGRLSEGEYSVPFFSTRHSHGLIHMPKSKGLPKISFELVHMKGNLHRKKGPAMTLKKKSKVKFLYAYGGHIYQLCVFPSADLTFYM